LVLSFYPAATCESKVSTGGSKIVEYAIHNGVTVIGPHSFTEDKAWRYAAERLGNRDAKAE